MIVGKRRPLGGWWGGPIVFLAPAVILFVLLFAGPAVSSMYVSLCKWTGFTPEMKFTGFRNFGKLMGDFGIQKTFPWVFTNGDARFWAGVKNNLWIMSVGGVLFFFFAMLFAAALNNPHFKGRKFFQTMIFFPAFISVVGTAVFWKLIYNSKSGLINLAIRGMGGEGIQWLDPKNAMYSIIVMMIWAGVGGTMILLLAGMRRIPRDYYEAAEIDGASAPQQFFHLTIPMMREVVIIALSLWMIGSMKVFGYVQALLAPAISDEAQVISTLQYEYAFSNRNCIFMMGRATSMAVVQLIMVLLLVWAVRSFRERQSVEY
ncbi:MAG TPA: sugar ABC transporter permease [Phycisphaerae bacterium]|nr:sugar ABC transporter permease [Phycisphaerae bacterium]